MQTQRMFYDNKSVQHNINDHISYCIVQVNSFMLCDEVAVIVPMIWLINCLRQT